MPRLGVQLVYSNSLGLTFPTAFTGPQMGKLATFASSNSILVTKTDNETALQQSTTPNTGTAITPIQSSTQRSADNEIKDQNVSGQHFIDLAQELGVETKLVQALAQRLAIVT